jgi:hypothetical protein
MDRTCLQFKFTKRRGREVNTPGPYFGGPGFKSRPGERILTEIFRDFHQSLQANTWIVS